MSQSSRRVVVPIGNADRLVSGLAGTYDAGDRIPRHCHESAQLIYATSGVMTVRTDAGRWVVPSQRAVWVPPLEDHSIRMSGSVEMRTVYVRADRIKGLSKSCAVVHVSPLLREIILRIVGFRSPLERNSRESRLAAVFLDEIRAAEQMPLHLPVPSDPRLQRITESLRQAPGNQNTLAQWAAVAGASERTLARLFADQTGLTFGQWRQQARLLAGLELLALGQSVTSVALDLGYESPSAFINMFRAALGTSPGKYFSTRDC